MHNTIIKSVFDFNSYVVKIGIRPLAPLGEAETDWLKTAIVEEALELSEAYLPSPDKPKAPSVVLVDQVDACVDAAIFAIGGLARMGLTQLQAEACFLAVMRANFEKKAGIKPGRQGAADAVKPEGWVGPEARIRSILNV